MKRLILFILLIISGNLKAQIESTAAKSILTQLALERNINTQDINSTIISDNYTSRNIDHVYFKQSLNEIEIHESSFSIHGVPGRYEFVQGNLIQGLSKKSFDQSNTLSAIQAITAVANQKGYDSPRDELIIFSSPNSANKRVVYEINNLSEARIPCKLVYYQKSKKQFALAWSLEIEDLKSDDYIHFIVDASDGTIIYEYNYTVSCSHGHVESKSEHTCESTSLAHPTIMTDSSYNVFKWPIEAPHNGPRTIEVKPWLDNTTASPNGWHTIGSNNYTTSRGNNVDAYIDPNNSNGPSGGDAARAQGGANLSFDFTLDTNGNPVDYKDAAVTNLFYWNNVSHDVWYNYGFDEPSGNFQEENLQGTGGNDSDYVRAEAQDGGGSCNANFSTPPDGGNPRMQMYLCNGRDGDLDNAVIVHEYGHGISIRLTGGPGTSSCLSGQEQMGEGWSDYFGMVMTIEPGDMATDSRGIGTWLFGQGPNGPGIRPYPYSTDFAVNPFTYDDIKGNVSVPHGLGSVWGTILWEVTWELIGVHGFDPDIYNGTGGNNIAMELVIEGLKFQPCNPGFVDGRNAIILADEMLYGGANQCLLWDAFARRGLGFSASQGSSNSRFDGNEAFDLPPSCTVELLKTVDITNADPGDTLTYNLKAINNSGAAYMNLLLSDTIPENTNFVSASNGGSYNVSTKLVSWPLVNIAVGDSIEYTLEVEIDEYTDGYVSDILDDIESGNELWSTVNYGNSQWNITSSDASSGTNSWFAADVSTYSIANLTLESPVGATATTQLSFNHKYDTEGTWDGGVVEISTNGGITWEDQESNFIQNGYNSTIYNSRPGFSGDSNGFINSIVDLSSYSGKNILIRFQMNCDQAVGGVGWWIDDISIIDISYLVPNIANISNTEVDINGVLLTPTAVSGDSSLLHISTSTSSLSCFESMDGSATVIPSSGTGTYFINWDNGSHAATISNLAAGSYDVTVNDGVTTRTATVMVTQPDSLDLTIIGSAAVGGATGFAEAIVSGGTPSYNYSWSNGGSDSKIQNVPAGNYIVSVTDNNGCQIIDSITLADPTTCTENVIQLNVQLDDFANEVSLYVRDGNGDVIYEKIFKSPENELLFTDYLCVPDDCYEVELIDSGANGICPFGSSAPGYYQIVDYATGDIIHSGCAFGASVFRDICFPFLTADFTYSAPSCTAAGDGEISINASGGSGNYTYSYGTGDTGPSVNNLQPGTYNVMVDDGITTASQIITLENSMATVYLDQNDGQGTLRYAIANACLTDTIVFKSTLATDTVNLLTPISISGVRTINGINASNLYVSGQNNTQLFQVPLTSSLSILNLNMKDAEANAPGGAIYNEGMLYLENVLFQNVNENGVGRPISGSGDVIIRGSVEVQD